MKNKVMIKLGHQFDPFNFIYKQNKNDINCVIFSLVMNWCHISIINCISWRGGLFVSVVWLGRCGSKKKRELLDLCVYLTKTYWQWGHFECLMIWLALIIYIFNLALFLLHLSLFLTKSKSETHLGDMFGFGAKIMGIIDFF